MSTQATDQFPYGRFRPAQGPRHRSNWQRHLRQNVKVVDAIAIYSAVMAAFFLRWGIAELDLLDPFHLTNQMAFSAMALLVVWYIGLSIADAWNTKIMGAGVAEYARVSNVTFAVFSLIAIGAYLTQQDIARSFVAIALPLGLIFLNFGRWALRQRLVRNRNRGRNMSRALVIAPPATAEHLVADFMRLPSTGIKIVAVCTPSETEFELPDELETTVVALSESTESLSTEISESDDTNVLDHLSSLDDVLPYALEHHLDAVVISGVDELTPKALKQLSWSLEPHHIELIIAPKLTDVASTRLVTHNVGGMPLLHVEMPGYTSRQQHIKRIFDFVGSSILIALFSIPMAIVALLIKITSPGPILFKQTRIGVNGEPFQVFKFRSMYPDAEARFNEVMGNNIGFINKVKNDPRITPIGKFIRRYSIDELPQLFNVWRGEMSLVGPRPALVREAELYDDGIERRLFVRQGMTGLWQVSGRSNLSPEEAMRLDLYYIENWSLTEDLLILVRTARAVLGKDGAY